MSVDVRANMRGGPLDLTLSLLVVVHGPLFVQLLLVFGKHVLLVFTGHGWGNSRDVFGWEGLLVIDRLDSVLSGASGSLFSNTPRQYGKPDSPGGGAHASPCR